MATLSCRRGAAIGMHQCMLEHGSCRKSFKAGPAYLRTATPQSLTSNLLQAALFPRSAAWPSARTRPQPFSLFSPAPEAPPQASQPSQHQPAWTKQQGDRRGLGSVWGEGDPATAAAEELGKIPGANAWVKAPAAITPPATAGVLACRMCVWAVCVIAAKFCPVMLWRGLCQDLLAIERLWILPA